MKTVPSEVILPDDKKENGYRRHIAFKKGMILFRPIQFSDLTVQLNLAHKTKEKGGQMKTSRTYPND